MGTELGPPGRPIYLDNQASTPIDPRVSAVMTACSAAHFANPHAADHESGWKALKVVDDSKRSIAGALGVDPDELIFTSGATESNNLAILGLARRSQQPRNRILVSAIEHKSVLAPVRSAARLGCTVEMIPVDSAGLVELSRLRELLGPDVLLVSVMAVNNEVGSVQPMAAIAEYTHASGAYLHTDAAQALAVDPYAPSTWDADLLSLSGHKIYGPKGIGILLVRRAVQARLEPLMYGGGQQEGLRPGTLPVPLCAGLATAVELMHTETGEFDRLRALRNELVEGLKRLDSRIDINGPSLSARHPGNANLRFPGYDAQDLLAGVQPHLCASTGSACTSGVPENSHVLMAIGLTTREAESSIRFSLGRFTTVDDIHHAVAIFARELSKHTY